MLSSTSLVKLKPVATVTFFLGWMGFAFYSNSQSLAAQPLTQLVVKSIFAVMLLGGLAGRLFAHQHPKRWVQMLKFVWLAVAVAVLATSVYMSYEQQVLARLQ